VSAFLIVFFGGCEFFIAFFELPLSRNAQKTRLKKIEQNNRGRGEKNGGKNPRFL
jgi:hypothetical protein